MSAHSRWVQTPRQSVEAACRDRGEKAVVAGCVDLLAGRRVDAELIASLGGPPAAWALDDTLRPGPDYWLRVWALRGLLWAWADNAAPAVVRALRDDAWRVREMALKVVRKRGLDEAVGKVADLQRDPNQRVRALATRVLGALTTSGEAG